MSVRPFVGSEVLEALGTGGVPKRAMHEPLRSPDDEVLQRPLGPGENATTSFDIDPELGDAGAEFANDFGRAYIDAATRDVDGESDEEEIGESTNIEEQLGTEEPPEDVDEESPPGAAEPERPAERRSQESSGSAVGNK